MQYISYIITDIFENSCSWITVRNVSTMYVHLVAWHQRLLNDKTYAPLTLKASGKVLSYIFSSSTFSLPDFPPPILFPLYFLHLIFSSSSFSLPNSIFPSHILPFFSLALFLQYAHHLRILRFFLVFLPVFFLCSLFFLLLHLHFRFLLYLQLLLLHLNFLSSPLVCSHSSFSHAVILIPLSILLFLLIFLYFPSSSYSFSLHSPHQHNMSSGTERNYVRGKIGQICPAA